MQNDTSGQIRINLRRGGRGSSVNSNAIFYRYSVSEAPQGEIGWDCVWGTAVDLRAWSAAEATFDAAIRAADRAYRRVVESWWTRELPGHAARVARAKQVYRGATETAQAAYQPVADAIAARQEAAMAERAAEQAERHRVHAHERAEQEERNRLRRALAERAIWGWSAVDPTTVRVFVSDEQKLTAAELDEALRGLYRSGVRTVEWDPAARDAVARACVPPGTSATDYDFQHWWMWEAAIGWIDVATIPPPRPPGSSRNTATFHHSDYGSHGTSF